ncbi:hypothetical protein SAY87_010218 [Trapa incisa]|uniref:Uncharacterized protein n=2 Tax=Trapa TaxID=22665 RepID=A0AAN7M108_TRANT|nr:hypothetical protein SAY87_010218 [Trapa incisa]KAK4795269.1 hypothetical protein SAY86_013263 [Trapa natans]
MAGFKVHFFSGMAAVVSGDVPCECSFPTSSKRESFTVWMKSLLMQKGNGCTVFNENGEIIYRMDNYDTRRSRKIYLMDLRGRVIFTIVKRKLCIFGCWEGYKSEDPSSNSRDERIWFRVRKQCSMVRKSLYCRVSMLHCKTPRSCYSMEGFASKLEFSIKSSTGAAVAEVKRKQTASGIYLGDDVLALVVEPLVDHSLIVALVAVYGSICRRM